MRFFEQHAVLVSFDEIDFDLMVEISERLTEVIEQADCGMFDGNEIGAGKMTLFMYGPDAEVLYSSIEPVLHSEPLLVGAKVILRWGGLGSPQREAVVGEFSRKQ